jgi:hypothetical protein
MSGFIDVPRLIFLRVFPYTRIAVATPHSRRPSDGRRLLRSNREGTPTRTSARCRGRHVKPLRIPSRGESIGHPGGPRRADRCAAAPGADRPETTPAPPFLPAHRIRVPSWAYIFGEILGKAVSYCTATSRSPRPSFLPSTPAITASK